MLNIKNYYHMKKQVPLIYFLISGIISLNIFFSSCSSHKEESIKIAISKAKPEKYYGSYAKWLKKADSTIECIGMYFIPIDSALLILENCSGLLLTGGPDVFPGEYNKAFDTTRCGTIDYKRDTLEFVLIKKAMDLNIPILGICRGEQILNVSMGGSLIVDIPSDFDTVVVHRCKDTKNCFHNVQIEPGSKLFWASNINSGIVNSNHHQAVDKLADKFKVTARSGDGLIEAIEWEEPHGKPFLIAVQWHPEKMDYDNPLSLPIAEYFLQEARLFHERQLSGE